MHQQKDLLIVIWSSNIFGWSVQISSGGPSCSQQCWSQVQMHIPRWVLWFGFNLWTKNRISHLNNCTANYTHYTLKLSLLISNRQFVHTWKTNWCPHGSKWVHPCSSLKAYWIIPPTTWHGTLWTASHGEGMAWLAQILLLIKVPTKELLNHTDTHHS